jgi:outer membrane protein
VVALAAAASMLVAGRARAEEPAAGAESPNLHRLSLEECVSSALGRNVDVLSAGEDVAAAEAERAGTRGALAPKVHLDASVQRWNDAYVFDGFPIHDVTVWNVTATLTQPVTALFAIYDQYKVKDLGVDIAAVRREAARRTAALQAAEGYYRLLQAERLAEVAVASVDKLGAQLRQANSFHDNGLVSQDDVLRAKLAVANAQQRLIQSRARVTLERSRLAVGLGLPPDAAIDARPLASDSPPPRDVLSLEQAERAAEGRRVELREVEKRIEATGRDKRIAYLKLAPQVSIVGAYIHNEGSLFSQTNSAYVGGVASWDVWDWGTTTSGISEAEARQRQALLARSKVADAIRLEVRQSFVDVGTTSDEMDVAKASVAAAEENFRLVKKRYEANAATSFDVVDAEGLLTQSRGQLQTALYDFLIARAALRAATGATPEALAQDHE